MKVCSLQLTNEKNGASSGNMKNKLVSWRLTEQPKGNVCEWCGEEFNQWNQLHHHVYRGLCPNDPYPDMRKPL